MTEFHISPITDRMLQMAQDFHVRTRPGETAFTGEVTTYPDAAATGRMLDRHFKYYDWWKRRADDSDVVREQWRRLDERTRGVLLARFGERPPSLRVLGERLRVSTSRARQIELEGMRRVAGALLAARRG